MSKSNSLLVYKKGQLKEYIDMRKELEIDVFSLPYIELQQNKFGCLLDLPEVDIDITSSVQLMSNDNGSARYFIEKLFYLLDNLELEVNYIICESYAEYAMQEFGYVFHNLKYLFNEDDFKEIIEGEINEEQSKKKILLVDKNREELNLLSKYLNENLIGHSDFKKEFINELNSFKYFFENIGDQPIMSVFLLGASGVGKTEFGRLLHKFLDLESPVAKINFGNYKSESSLSSLIGSPPGYVDSGKESDLVKKIQKSNTGILLVDEFEKANSAVHNFFLQLLEEGQFDDALGNIHNLKGYVIVFTSNASTEEFLKKTPPELKSRFDLTFIFDPLTKDDKIDFTKKIIINYSSESKTVISPEEIEKMMSQIKIDDENNLRNLKKSIRRRFFRFVMEKSLE